MSAIKWDNVILYGQYVLDRAPGALRNGSLCCISTPMWALPWIRIQLRCHITHEVLEDLERLLARRPPREPGTLNA